MNFPLLKFNDHSGRRIFYFLLFLTLLAYFLWLNATPSFSDPDAFYHAKITKLIKQSGPIKNFTWLPFTTLNDIYIDHQLLYHLLLIPWFYIFNPLMAVKLAAAFFAALMILTFQWLLDKFKVNYAWAYTLLLLTAYQFIFRINLVKTSALSLIFLLFFIYLIFKHRGRWSWPLFILSTAYVWLYGGWIIALGIGCIDWLMRGLDSWRQNYQTQKQKRRISITTAWFGAPQLKFLANFMAGMVCGLVINPYFPTNLKFYWEQIFQIALVNYKNVVAVGSEWYSISLFDLIRHNVLIFSVWLLAVLIFFIYLNKQKRQHWTLLLTDFIFLGLTLKAKRNFEYLLPLAVLFSTLVINDFAKLKQPAEIKKLLQKYILHYRTISFILILSLLVYLPILWQANFKGLPQALGYNYSFSQFNETGQWLKKHTRPKEIIFHDRWDDWPALFYHNSHNRYIIGLDPTFMYLKNKGRYLLWQKIVRAKIKKPCRLIKQKFESSYIFVKNDNLKFRHNLAADKSCRLVHRDKDGQIYKIINF